MWKWKATIRTQWSDIQIVISAPDQHSAKVLLESQYGVGSILGNHITRI